MKYFWRQDHFLNYHGIQSLLELFASFALSKQFTLKFSQNLNFSF